MAAASSPSVNTVHALENGAGQSTGSPTQEEGSRRDVVRRRTDAGREKRGAFGFWTLGVWTLGKEGPERHCCGSTTEQDKAADEK